MVSEITRQNSSSNEPTYIIEEKPENVEKKAIEGAFSDKTKSSKRVVECHSNSGASCNVISHSLVCKLLQDWNSRLQEIETANV